MKIEKPDYNTTIEADYKAKRLANHTSLHLSNELGLKKSKMHTLFPLYM